MSRKRRNEVSENPKSLALVDRVNARLADKISKTSGGKISVCEHCGQPFEQVWKPSHGIYTQFKLCHDCRMTVARGETRVVIPYRPHSGQQLIHASNVRFKLIAAGSRWGKDRCCVMEYIQKFAQMLSEDRGPELVPAVHGWIIAPTYRLARQIWREFKAYFPREWVVNYWESDLMVETVNDGIIEVRSADDPEMLVGVGLDLVWITEAARIARLEEVWANLETRLMSPGRGPGGNGGIALINGTPRGRNFYYRMFRWGQKDDPLCDPDWESWKFPSWDNPYLSAKDKQSLERMKKRYPERIYRQEIEAEFLAEGNSVFPTAEECATYMGNGRPEPGEVYVIGYDPARSVDYSGVAIRNSLGEAVYVAQWSGKPWTVQMDEIAMLAQMYNYAHVVMDRTGLGETLPEALQQRGLSVEAVYFSNPEKEKMVNNLAMLIEQKLISYPSNEVLINELKDYEYTITKTGTIKYSASTSAKHDDLVTAMMLAYKDFNTPEFALPWMGLLEGVKKRAS
jgi:hypothetical protein